MKPTSSHCRCQSGRGVMDSRSIQEPELLREAELEPKPPRLMLLLPIARLPLRTGRDALPTAEPERRLLPA